MSNNEKAIRITRLIKEIEKKKKRINKWIIREYAKDTEGSKNMIGAMELMNYKLNSPSNTKEFYFAKNGAKQLTDHLDFLDEVLSYREKANRTKISFLSIVILSIITIVWISNARYKSLTKERYEKLEQRSTDKKYGDVHGAWAYMQIFVEKQLKSPKSADFPIGGYRHVTDLGGGRYKVNSYVDSKNAFNATVRTHFNGVIKRKNGGWVLEYLNFIK